MCLWVPVSLPPKTQVSLEGLLALWRVQKAQVTQPLSETLGIKGYVVITPYATELKKNAMYRLYT